MKNKIPNQQTLLKLISDKQVNHHPSFNAGDLVTVSERIFDGKKFRIQKFQGIVLKRSGSGVSENVLIRKESSNDVRVEKIFPIHSPLIEKIDVERYGKVRRAYISYMRNRSGKAARIKEDKRRSNKKFA
ncbi:LSU ribosomal protein L19p [[Mycoplasma] cavipharyngis]|uniref:50S ribosomal protein L19 n=1 Tax=[Mycoplasma] cavipharyngis TaxID=92757 RepID=UPI003703DEBC